MQRSADQIIVYTDGGSRGNPGPAAAGFVLTEDAGTELQANAFYLGCTTNNVAEYTGLVKALEAARQIGAGRLKIFSDSKLLVEQINGRYKVKSQQLKPLFQRSLDLLAGFEKWQVQFIPRNENKQADELVNRALNLEADVEAKPVDSNRTDTSRYKKPVRLGVLISGGGTTLMNIVKYINHGRLNAEVAGVISSRSTVAGVEKARSAGLNVEIVRKKDSPHIDDFSRRIEQKLTAAKVDLVVQGGWLCLWKIPQKYTSRVMNIHPALLPSFGGEGMFGHHVHEAVLKAGCKISGCTVHFCTNQYDEGPIILQRSCPVREGDTAETLAARVFEQECIAFPKAIELFAEGKLLVENGRVKIKS